MLAEPGTVLFTGAGHNKSISQTRSKTWVESRQALWNGYSTGQVEGWKKAFSGGAPPLRTSSV